ncbi:hypothetical protein E3N88_12521 [Mikania micrantha]|uniref:Uncharacterized protein n=1 Tax=Mikania micrantha TaxID=192012 RepID=A0A5N6P7K4_9ASTR|nr:hypothetical protein E3N88_12521 [Mikania micrantha]
MFKHRQELKKHQEFDDFRGQNAINQLSLTREKQSSGSQFGVLNTGIRVRDPSEMFMFGNTNWVCGFSRFANSNFQSPFGESADMLTKNTSQQAGIFGQSLIGNHFSGSIDQKLSNREDGSSLGTEKCRNLFPKTENLGDFRAIQSGRSGVLMQAAVSEASSSDENLKTGECGTKSSGNMFKLLHKVDKEHAYSVSINRVPKSEPDDASAPSYDNKNNAAHSPYFGLMLTTQSQMPLQGHFTKPSQSPKSENDQFLNQNCMTSHIVSVKQDDGQKLSNKQLDAPVQQNPSVTNSNTRNQSSLHLKSLDVANQRTGVLKSKKRKRSTVKRLPCNKKVTEGSSRLHDISTPELWAHSTGRLPEKVNIDEITDSCYEKRRLSLTTRLMQLLFQPPPTFVLSEDAITHCDTLTYYASKSAPPAETNMTSKSSSDQDLIKVIEGFIDRSKRLEVDVSRLEKAGSLLFEVKMGSRDLEKLSFINRFAKFHTRRSTVTRPMVMDATSSSASASSPTRRPHLEMYVKALPMPKSIPEVQDCLFL